LRLLSNVTSLGVMGGGAAGGDVIGGDGKIEAETQVALETTLLPRIYLMTKTGEWKEERQGTEADSAHFGGMRFHA